MMTTNSLSYRGASKLYEKPVEKSTTNIPGLENNNMDSGASLDTIGFSAKKRIRLGNSTLDLTLGAIHNLNDHAYSYANNNYDDRTRLWFALSMDL